MEEIQVVKLKNTEESLKGIISSLDSMLLFFISKLSSSQVRPSMEASSRAAEELLVNLCFKSGLSKFEIIAALLVACQAAIADSLDLYKEVNENAKKTQSN